MARQRSRQRQGEADVPRRTLQPNNTIDPSVFLGSMTRYRQPRFPDALRTELSIPLDSHLITTTLRSPLGYHGYIWEMVGAFPRPDTPIEVFWFLREIWMERYNIPGIVVYRRRVLHTNTPVFLEWRWHPDHGVSLEIRGMVQDTRKGSVLLAHDSLPLLEAIAPTGGRPLDFEDKLTFWRLYWEAYQNVYKEQQRVGNRRPTKTQVASEMLIDLKTLYRYRKRHMLAWPPPPPP